MFNDEFRENVVKDYLNSGLTLPMFCKNQIPDLNPSRLSLWIKDSRRKIRLANQDKVLTGITETLKVSPKKEKQKKALVEIHNFYSKKPTAGTKHFENIYIVENHKENIGEKNPITFVCFEMPKTKENKLLEVEIPILTYKSKFEFYNEQYRICSYLMNLKNNNNTRFFLKELKEELNELTV